MKPLIFTLLLTLIWSSSFAQSAQNINALDSLKHQLSIARQDTSRVLIMVNLCNRYRLWKPDSAFRYGEKALKLTQKIKFLRGECNVLWTLSRAHREVGNFPKALDLSLKALRIADENQYLNEQMECFVTIGVIYFDLHDYPKYIDYSKKARDIALNLHNKSQVFAQEIQIAAGYFRKNQWDSVYYYTGLSNQGKVPSNYNGNIQTLYRILGWINIKSGNNAMAVYHFKQGIKSSLRNNDRRNASFNNNEVANFYFKLNKLDSCIFYAKQGLSEARKGPFNIRILESSALLASAYKIKNDYKQAYEYQELMIKTKESLYGAGNIQAMQNMIADDEARQKEVEAQRVAYQNKLRQYAFLAGLGVLLAIAFLLYRNNRQKHKANILLNEQKEKVEQTLKTLQSTQAQLIQKEKLASLGELTAGIAHEIQNPLNFVNNFSELSVDLAQELNEEIDKEPINKEFVKELMGDLTQNQEKINHHGKRAASIVKGMLEHSKASTGERELTDINQLADEYLRLSYHGLRAKDNHFNSDYELIMDENLPKIEVVPQEMGRVLLNLLNNAFYAVNERKKQADLHYQPKVTVTTQTIDNQIKISVADNGTGIPDSIKAKIFQPFFTTKPTGEGTGLGLSLAYDIVTKGHGGTLEVESVEGQGTTFTVKIPYYK